MVFARYEKKGASIYTPHLDLLRSVSMASRRSSLNIKYSEGFNPHARVFFVQPLPIGTYSECEYMTIDTDESTEDVMKKLNKSLPDGMKILSAKKTDTNPNIAALMFKADYEVEFEKSIELADFESVQKQESLEITFMHKGKQKTKDVRDMIYKMSGSGRKYYFTLACGNINLRADRLVNHFLQLIGQEDLYYTVTRKQLYTKQDQNIDELF